MGARYLYERAKGHLNRGDLLVIYFDPRALGGMNGSGVYPLGCQRSYFEKNVYQMGSLGTATNNIFTTDIDSCLASLETLVQPSAYHVGFLNSLIFLFNSRGGFLVYLFLITLSLVILAAEFYSQRRCEGVYKELQYRLA